MKSTVKIIAAAGIMAAVVGVAGAGSAQAQSVSSTLPYSCKLGTDVPIKGVIHAQLPDRAEAGRTTGKSTISVETTVDATSVRILKLLGVASAKATLDTNIKATGAGGTRSIPLRLTAPERHLPSSGSMRVTASGTVPGQNFAIPGKVTLHAGDFTLHATAVTKNGDQNVNAPCALKTNNDVLASVQVKAAGSGTSGTDPSSAAQTGGAGKDDDALADTGQSTAWLLPVSASTAAAGATAVVTVWLRRRRSGQSA
ncbi:DUF6801 domain-containing protein [Streptomyces odontomachi]|uniref:DUF6801 domain-containing protein n=1 Tax=Streptomyces odontomachi TaxID=2944940 RepID=UPI00210A09D7|nr:DUF6801 domain-containing protein [Streptomyces sp. ODS25]